MSAPHETPDMGSRGSRSGGAGGVAGQHRQQQQQQQQLGGQPTPPQPANYLPGKKISTQFDTASGSASDTDSLLLLPNREKKSSARSASALGTLLPKSSLTTPFTVPEAVVSPGGSQHSDESATSQIGDETGPFDDDYESDEEQRHYQQQYQPQPQEGGLVGHSSGGDDHKQHISHKPKRIEFECKCCSTKMIVNFWKCGNCAKFHLCQKCKADGLVRHNTNHVFLWIEKPLPSEFEESLLKKNLYSEAKRGTRYKTALCHYFRNGECRYAENCRFAHGPQDLRVGNPLSPSDATSSPLQNVESTAAITTSTPSTPASSPATTVTLVTTALGAVSISGDQPATGTQDTSSAVSSSPQISTASEASNDTTSSNSQQPLVPIHQPPSQVLPQHHTTYVPLHPHILPHHIQQVSNSLLLPPPSRHLAGSSNFVYPPAGSTASSSSSGIPVSAGAWPLGHSPQFFVAGPEVPTSQYIRPSTNSMYQQQQQHQPHMLIMPPHQEAININSLRATHEVIFQDHSTNAIFKCSVVNTRPTLTIPVRYLGDLQPQPSFQLFPRSEITVHVRGLTIPSSVSERKRVTDFSAGEINLAHYLYPTNMYIFTAISFPQ